MLEEMGYVVTGEADNGNDACILARNLKPDLAILDIMMAGTSGLEAAATIGRERLAPVLLLTAYSEAEMIDQAVQAGVSAYLVKPFRRQELEPTIALAMSRYRELVALEGERDQLQEQLETRRLVGKAKAILMERQELSEREAYRRIQAQSLAMGRTLRQIAEAVILTDEMNVLTP